MQHAILNHRRSHISSHAAVPQHANGKFSIALNEGVLGVNRLPATADYRQMDKSIVSTLMFSVVGLSAPQR